MKSLILPTNKPTTITINMQLNLSFHSWKHLLDQVTNSFSTMGRSLLQQIAAQACDHIYREFLELCPNLRINKEKERKILTEFGEIFLKDYEVSTVKKKYLGRSLQFILGMKKHERITPKAKALLMKAITRLTYRETADLFSHMNVSHQRLNAYIRSIEVTNILTYITPFLKKIKKRIFVWLDGTCIRIRNKRRDDVSKETLRIAFRESISNNKKNIKLAFGFVDKTYNQLFKSIVSDDERRHVIAFADGEKIIELALTGIKAFQRCIFHFSWNLSTKLIYNGMSKEHAQILIDDLKPIIYLRAKEIRDIGKYWKTVVKKRKNLIKTYSTNLLENGFTKGSAYLARAAPYLFTYVEIYAKEKIWIGRTTNKIERLMRRIAKRMKRTGAIWSRDGAMKMLYLILIDCFKMPFAFKKSCHFTLTVISGVKF